MLNCTLSANLNGLNLGTGTRANVASLNIVGNLSLLRAGHPQMRSHSMRDDHVKSVDDPKRLILGYLPISQPSSSPQTSLSWWFTTAGASAASVEVVVPAVSRPEVARRRVTSPPRPCGARETTVRCESSPVARLFATGG